MTSARLCIGMTLAPTWLNGHAWRRPDSGIEQLLDLSYFRDLAQRAEAAGADFLFRPDTLFHPNLANGPGGGAGGLDPTLLMTALAGATTRINLLTTISATFLPPWYVARMLMSLNWLSGGRIGWNVVTALDGHRNFGLETMPSGAERYEKAAEFHALVTRLWDSFPAEALLQDREGGRILDETQIHPVDHDGAHFRVEGPLSLPAMPGKRIPIFQAGASEIGRDFAARIADGVFAATPDRDAAQAYRGDILRRAAGHGRAQAPKVLPGLSLFLASSRAEAQDLFHATHRGADRARRMARLKLLTGVDFSDWPDDRAVTLADLPALPEGLHSQTSALLLRRMIERDRPRLDDLLERPETIGSPHWQVIGTPDDAIDAVRDWQATEAADGFIAFPGGSVACLKLVLDEVIAPLADPASLWDCDAERPTGFAALFGA
ncbi:NtaA/DmoA family FMN-dependent monooxygenase [Pararhodobacter sp. CCB-MM2]|uniref:NtaA/DmoA family FMN-dependent monooxygenase n=1 Tax=Pararhodobacter sp. CCB-MM2 TaxID=1786003 RepID=UPI000831597B|nr:NtaA/DmoA family FMN-dependent monooxygenase [Pararhodobacter sp. CCB-MM2]